jgi:hypothetical protein
MGLAGMLNGRVRLSFYDEKSDPADLSAESFFGKNQRMDSVCSTCQEAQITPY